MVGNGQVFANIVENIQIPSKECYFFEWKRNWIMSISCLLSVSWPFLTKMANSLTKDKKVTFHLFPFSRPLYKGFNMNCTQYATFCPFGILLPFGQLTPRRLETCTSFCKENKSAKASPKIWQLLSTSGPPSAGHLSNDFQTASKE